MACSEGKKVAFGTYTLVEEAEYSWENTHQCLEAEGQDVIRVYGLSSFVPHRLVCKTCVVLVPYHLVYKKLCLISIIYRDTL